MLNKSALNNYLLYLYTLIAYNFFYYVGLSNTLIKLPLFILIPAMILICWKTINQRNNDVLFNTMKWIFFTTIFSIFSAWLFREQSLMLGYRATVPMLSFVLFFYLIKNKPSIDFIERFIIFWGLLYVLLWIYAYTQSPQRIFGAGEDDVLQDMSRGMLRITFTGKLLMILAYFLCIVKGFISKRKIYFIGAALFFFFLILNVVRQLILWTALVTIYYLYQKNRKLIITGGLVLFFSTMILGSIKFSDDSVIGTMISLTQKQAEDSKYEENIRMTAYKYFMGDYSANFFTNIIGNGMPHFDSEYGKSYVFKDQGKGLYLSDVGYARMYAVTGLIGLILYLFLFYKSLLTKIPQQLYYAKLFIMFMIPANIAADWYAKPDGQIGICICIYILIMYNLNNNKYEIQHNHPRI